MISILIRNKNEAKALENALMSIRAQVFDVPYEIVLVDDSSTDNSIEIAKKYDCKIVSLDRKFTYGYAINFGVKNCQYEIILLLSSHNILLSTDFPEKLVRYFKDESIAAVRCTPIANSKQIVTSLRSLITIDSKNYNHQNDWQNLIIANCSAIRKKVAVEIPFNESIRSNEEKLWCLQVIKKGYTILSNVPCYHIYNKKNNSSVVIRDVISKYQVDGVRPITLGRYVINTLKSIPWSFKIAFTTFYRNFKLNTQSVLIPFKHKKGLYK